jgi:hypothetical protein
LKAARGVLVIHAMRILQDGELAAAQSLRFRQSSLGVNDIRERDRSC